MSRYDWPEKCTRIYHFCHKVVESYGYKVVEEFCYKAAESEIYCHKVVESNFDGEMIEEEADYNDKTSSVM